MCIEKFLKWSPTSKACDSRTNASLGRTSRTIPTESGLVLGLTFISIAAFFLASPVSALEIKQLNIPPKNDIVISPGKTEFLADPGETFSAYFTVTNRLGERRDFVISIEDFEGGKGKEKTIVFKGKERGRFSLKDWLEPETGGFTLNHGEAGKIVVNIKIPDTAQPGGHYAAVFAKAKPKPVEIGKPAEGATSQIVLVSQAASLFFVRVSGPVVEEGRIENFKTSQKIYFSPPINFSYDFRNLGTVHLAPKASIEIFNIFGNEVEELTSALSFALPDSVRSDFISWKKAWLFGRYKAKLKVIYGLGGEKIETAQTTFYVLNSKIGAIILGGLVFFYLAYHFIFSRFEIKKRR